MEDFYFTEYYQDFHLIYSPVCGSTNDVSKSAVAVFGSDLPLAVYTFDQQDGRGQRGNVWNSEPGKNLAVTFVFSEKQIGVKSPVVFNKAFTLAIQKAIETASECPCLIKWPNDIFCLGKKISGILIETMQTKDGKKCYLAGVGVNVNQTTFADGLKATSLSLATGKTFELLQLLKEIIYNILFYIKDIEIDRISQEYRGNLLFQNQKSHLVKPDGTSFEAEIVDVDDAGRLVVKGADGELQSWHHGEVRLSIS